MYRTISFFCVVSTLSLSLFSGSGFAADYSSMTTEELSNLRGTMSNASQEDRDAFRAEWTERINQMSAEDKERYLGSGGGRGQGNRSGTGLGDGTGRGRGGNEIGNGANGAGNGQGTGQGNNRQ